MKRRTFLKFTSVISAVAFLPKSRLIGQMISEKNPVNIVVGDSQMQQLFQGSIAEINQGIGALFLNEYAR